MENNNAHNEINAEFIAAVNCVVFAALHVKVIAMRFAKDFGKEKADELLQAVAHGQFDMLIPEIEEKIIKNKIKKSTKKVHDSISKMVLLANLVRDAFKSSEISVIMSPRTCIMWAENFEIFGDIDHAFKLSFLNKCDLNDQKIINEFYQRCFGRELITNFE